ncbi:hypothetical protein DVH24_024970 [Malus domestica]|uniref:Uncharacterized protein n=1 Tax=Malus domestica TaxID=3750 RepID=A0A498JJR7_MALDO|nr:hypothetical protein DVH24_024970 [Malus domestica]
MSHPGLDSAVTRYCPLWVPTTPSRNSHDNFPVGHPSWDCMRLLSNSLNFGVPMEPEVSELPKALYENIHIRHRRSTSLGDVGCCNPPPLGA